MTNRSENGKVERGGRPEWVPVAKMRVSPVAQRELQRSRVDYLAANFDPEQLGMPTVNHRDGWFYIIDGQHRTEGFKSWEPNWKTQKLFCWVLQGLSDQEMADKFDRLNDTLNVIAFDKFRIRREAGRELECDIDRIIRSQDLVISREQVPGAIQAVGALTKTYARGAPATLARAVRIDRDAFGDAGMVAPIIEGLGLLCARYNGDLHDDDAVEKLARINGGVGGLLGLARKQREKMGGTLAAGVAASAVEIINRGRGGKKLPSWWKA